MAGGETVKAFSTCLDALTVQVLSRAITRFTTSLNPSTFFFIVCHTKTFTYACLHCLPLEAKIWPWKYSERSTIWKFIDIQFFMLLKINSCKCRNEQKYRTTFSTCPGITGSSFTMLWGTGIETKPNFHRGYAVSIKTIHLSSKDCLAGYRYEKAAVINEHYTHNSLLKL